MPSSDQIDWTSIPSEERTRVAIAIAHGACTRPPNGVRMQTRQSPISSRKRSTTIVRSDGTAPVAFWVADLFIDYVGYQWLPRALSAWFARLLSLAKSCKVTLADVSANKATATLLWYTSRRGPVSAKVMAAKAPAWCCDRSAPDC